MSPNRQLGIPGVLAVVTALLGVAPAARAATPGTSAEPPSTTAPAPASADELAARAAFDEGLRLMAREDFAAAKFIFDEIVTRYPTTTYAPSAASMSSMAASRLGETPAAPTPGADSGPGPGAAGAPPKDMDWGDGSTAGSDSGSAALSDDDFAIDPEASEAHRALILKKRARRAKIQLMIGMGIFGGYAGMAGIIIGNPSPNSDAASLLVLLPFAGAGVGVVGSWLIANQAKDFSDGDMSAVVGGAGWGTLNGILLVGASGWAENRIEPARMTLGIGLAGGAIGVTAGALGAYALRPRAGTMAVMNSGGMYGVTTGFLLAVAIDNLNSGRFAALTTLIGTDVGLVGGLIAGALLDVGRGRMAFIDLGAAVGLAAGFSIAAILVQPLLDVSNPAQGMAVGALGGMALGITATVLLTRKMDKRRLEREKLLEGDGEKRSKRRGPIRFAMPAPAALPTPGLMAGVPGAMPALGIALSGELF